MTICTENTGNGSGNGKQHDEVMIMNPEHSKQFAEYLKKEKTLARMMLNRADEFAELPALRHLNNGTWETIRWKEFGEQIRLVARALLEMGVETGDMVAIFSRNCPRWAISDLGILSIRGVTVPIYATNSAEEVEYIVNDAGVSILFAGDQEQYDKAKKVLGKSPHLTTIIAMDDAITVSGDDSYTFEQVLETGRRSSRENELEELLSTVESDDMLTLIYTSGTTGNPKGAVHTHKSFMAGIFPSLIRFRDYGSGYVSLAILPLSHVFERMWSYGCMSKGIEIAYCPDPKQFVEVMAAVKPHLLTSVPRIWEKVYGTINEGLKDASPVKRKLFSWATKTALRAYRRRKAGAPVGLFLSISRGLADALVCKKVRQRLGCERNIVYHVGGAAFAREINEFFQSFGINIIQGYGLTEFFPVCVGFDDHGIPGKCGPVIPMVEVRIADDGEIQVKGENAMKEYFGRERETAAMFAPDGWFRTGDVGTLEGDELQYITITDRIKDLIITAGGKNIAPQQIELMLGDELFIEQIVCVGEGKKYISALVVPNFELLEDYAKEQGLSFSSKEDLVRLPEIVRLYEDKVAYHTRELGQVEKIKKITLMTVPFSQENGEMTPTLKIKRKVVNTKYRDVIDAMYSE